MRFLLDTHILIWSALDPAKLSAGALKLVEDGRNDLFFSAVSIWEIAIKRALKKPDFDVDPRDMRRSCLDIGMTEIAMTSNHAIIVSGLPTIPRDPFDRLLLAQAIGEAIELLTSDAAIARYDGPIRRV